MNKAITLILSVALGGCSGCGNDSANNDAGGDADNGNNTFDQCDGDAASFVRQSFLALDGRRPKSQAEVDVYVALYHQAAEQELDPQDVVARAIMNRPEFAERWVDVIMDALHVQRFDIQNESNCWDQAVRTPVSPGLAMAVRDKPATQPADGQTFTMLDLARSSLALDDLTPIYRGQLFSLIANPLPAANVGDVQTELARRADFGATFDASYLHRDTVCLGCHNSEAAITDSDDPAHDRHWPVPGTAEKAIYGVSTGVSAERAHAVFRFDGFGDTGSQRPWGWATACGTFASPTSVGPDIAGIDAKLGNATGNRVTVHDVESALARGFAALRANGAPAGPIADPDVALAWLVTLKMTEDIWRQATGTSLTIANYFPRNQASSELLYSLASRFVASGFSLKALLVAIVSSDYFNRQAPDASCGTSPYSYPNVFDPWVTAESDEERRQNGPGDAVTAVDARTLVSAGAAALEWGPPPLASRFPDYGDTGCANLTCQTAMSRCNQFNQCCTMYQASCVMNGVVPAQELPFQRNVGMFLRNSERGFRGLDFQGRLAWQNRYGACTKPRWVGQDFIDRLAAAATAHATATAGDAIAALKDRLVGEPAIAEGPEAAALTAIVGALDAPSSTVTADALRRVCGALVESPQFLLQGIAGRGGERPILTPASADFDAVCAELATSGLGVPGQVVTCLPGELALAAGRTVTPPPAAPAVVHEPIERRGIAEPRRDRGM